MTDRLRFSANLGFLWTDLTLPDAVRAAARTGFDAVECHFPYDTDRGELCDALDAGRLPMLGLNTRRGRAGDFGLAAVPGRESEARDSIDEALDYAADIGAGYVHVMAGFAAGDAARACFAEALAYACDGADRQDATILIEPLNARDVPGYFLSSTTQALELVAEIARPRLKLLFDCYHVQIIDGDAIGRLAEVLPHVGHIQIASVPDRAEPDHGELDYPALFAALRQAGYGAPIGAEYRPAGAVEDGLRWMRAARAAE